MIVAFLAWWGGQLVGLLPPWLRRAVGPEKDALLIAPINASGEASLEIALRRNGREAPLGEVALGSAEFENLSQVTRQPAALRLTRADVLEKSLTLPLAAQSRLNQVLAFEMDQETPFAADEVYWNHCVEAVDRRKGQLSVRLLVLPKANLAPLLGSLAASGIVPRWAEIADAPAECRHLPLDGDRDRPRESAYRFLRPLAIGCAVLALGAVVTPFVRQSLVLATLDSEVKAGKATASQAESLRREIDLLSRGAELVDGELAKAGRPLEILVTLTQLLPDDTFLTELEMRQRKLTLSGRSASAARLIGALAGDGKLRNPTFAAPVTRLEAVNGEVFTITAEAGPRS